MTEINNMHDYVFNVLSPENGTEWTNETLALAMAFRVFHVS